MYALRIMAITFCVTLLVICQFAKAEESCPRTTFDDKTFSEPRPGEYQGQSLEFVVDTVDYGEYRSKRQ